MKTQDSPLFLHEFQQKEFPCHFHQQYLLGACLLSSYIQA